MPSFHLHVVFIATLPAVSSVDREPDLEHRVKAESLMLR
jgi:hypothetical protein